MFSFCFFFAVVGSVATSGSVVGSGSVADFGVCWRVGTLSKFFIGNNLLLKLSRRFSVALNNNP